MFKIIVTSLFLFTISFSNDKIKLLTEEYPPFQMVVDGELSGISIEIIKELQKRVGNSEKIRVFPWNRGYNLTLKKEGYALFLTTRTTKREKLFKWVGPILDYEVLFFKLKSNKKEYHTLNDVRKAKSIGVVKNDVKEQLLIENNFNNLQYIISGSIQTNLQKLVNGQIELWPSGYKSTQYVIKKYKLENIVVATKTHLFTQASLNIAFNKNTPEHIIKKWQNALDDIKKDEIYTKILNKYK